MINFNLLTSKIQYGTGLVGGMPDICCPGLLGVVLQLDAGQAELREFLQLPLIAIVRLSFTSLKNLHSSCSERNDCSSDTDPTP